VWDVTGGVVASVCVFIRRFSLIRCDIDQHWTANNGVMTVERRAAIGEIIATPLSPARAV
jgi:hypothetical protein